MMDRLWRVLIGFAAVLLAGCAGQQPSAQTYVGLRHPPEPAGVETEAGWMLEGRGTEEFAISTMRDAQGRMLWLERLVSRDSGGRATFEVLAVQRLPEIRQGEVLGIVGCRQGSSGAMSTGLVAIVRHDKAAENLGGARHAWRVDVAGRRFVAIPAAGVECANEAAGV